MSSKISLCHYNTGHLGLRIETKLVISFISIITLFGFSQVPIQYAEGAISWNGFLKQVGFNPPSVYEVSDVSLISAGGSDMLGSPVELLCSDGDWLRETGDTGLGVVLSTDEPSLDLENITIFASGSIIREDEQGIEIQYRKVIGFDGVAKRNEPFSSDIRVTITILCHSPSSFMTVGGEWIATDTTALIIGYSVLNLYWIAPIGIGIGLGIYLVKRRF